jgi:hypothetical protein
LNTGRNWELGLKTSEVGWLAADFQPAFHHKQLKQACLFILQIAVPWFTASCGAGVLFDSGHSRVV